MDADAKTLPTSKRRHDATLVATTNELRLAEFRARFKSHALSVDFVRSSNIRLCAWRVLSADCSIVRTYGFDSDLDSILKQLDAGIPFESATTIPNNGAASGPVKSSTGNLTGGPFCVVCDVAGGLPCPSMVRQALDCGIKLAYPPGDARLVPNHVHPGRCRKRLKQWLVAAGQL
jgi:hypothetical protein